MLTIVWDSERTRFIDDRFALTIWSGESVGFRNRITTLSMTSPAECAAVSAAINEAALSASEMASSSGDYPGVPEIISWRAMTSRGELSVCMVWGIIPNGAIQRGVMHGDYRFVVVLEDELDECLSRIFQLERMLTP